MFDSLGIKDLEWSKKLGVASYDLLYHFSEIMLSRKISFVVESNFKPEFANLKFLELKRRYQFESFQIHCHAPTEILFERFKKRVASGERHPGHGDESHQEEFKEKMSALKHGALEIEGEVLELNTTDFSTIDHDHIMRVIEAWMTKS